jgi:hypothetical protein
VFTQTKSSVFYSTYDARDLVKNGNYKGIDFAFGEMGDGFAISEFPKPAKGGDNAAAQNLDGEIGSENTRSISYYCSIQTSGDDAFDVADFLDWLARETIKQIESGKGRVVGGRHKVGKRFQIEYAQNGFTGRLEVYADPTGEDRMDLDVEIIERS